MNFSITGGVTNMNKTKELLKLSIISETNYRYSFSDEEETRDDAQHQMEYELEIPNLDFQSLIDLMIELKHEKIETVHYYCSKIIPFDPHAPVNVWNHFSTIEKNSLRNRGVGIYEKPMYIFYVKEFSSFLILSVRNMNTYTEDRLTKVFNKLM